MDFDGKVALITGAASGIGRAVALKFVERCARVTAVDRSASGLERLSEEVREAGREVLPVVADVSRADEVQAAVNRAMEAFGRLDIAVASAGINGVRAPIDQIEPEEWDDVCGTNLKGTFLTLKYVVPHLKRNGGSVVVIGSTNGTRVFSVGGLSAYAATKAGQVALAKMAALELARYGIRVNCVCPGIIETAILDAMKVRDLEHAALPAHFPDGTIPLTHGKAGRPEQVADLVLFLASDLASHITGTDVYIDGAESLLGETAYPS